MTVCDFCGFIQEVTESVSRVAGCFVGCAEQGLNVTSARVRKI